MADLVLDAGVLIAAERGQRSVWRFLANCFLKEDEPIVPAGALAQAWRGGPRQARLVRLLESCAIADMDEQMARATGALCGKAGTADVVDASVVMTAVRHRAVVITDDVDDIQPLADIAGVIVIPMPRD